ncbi:hypothetical protein H4R33_000410 [Dimargaris cristalligena]|nr:hypothetical protein H4R33_000410 [Dimargaris cristalligena]
MSTSTATAARVLTLDDSIYADPAPLTKKPPPAPISIVGSATPSRSRNSNQRHGRGNNNNNTTSSPSQQSRRRGPKPAHNNHNNRSSEPSPRLKNPSSNLSSPGPSSPSLLPQSGRIPLCERPEVQGRRGGRRPENGRSDANQSRNRPGKPRHANRGLHSPDSSGSHADDQSIRERNQQRKIQSASQREWDMPKTHTHHQRPRGSFKPGHRQTVPVSPPLSPIKASSITPGGTLVAPEAMSRAPSLASTSSASMPMSRKTPVTMQPYSPTTPSHPNAPTPALPPPVSKTAPSKPATPPSPIVEQETTKPTPTEPPVSAVASQAGLDDDMVSFLKSSEHVAWDEDDDW